MQGDILVEMSDAAALTRIRQKMEDRGELWGRLVNPPLAHEVYLYVIKMKRFTLAYTWSRARREICYLDVFQGGVDDDRINDLKTRFLQTRAP